MKTACIFQILTTSEQTETEGRKGFNPFVSKFTCSVCKKLKKKIENRKEILYQHKFIKFVTLLPSVIIMHFVFNILMSAKYKIELRKKKLKRENFNLFIQLQQ